MSARNYKILIVDDDPAFHQRTRYALRRNYEFEGAIGEDKLRKKVEEGIEYDLILLDLVLDNTKHKVGLDLIPYLQKKYPETPIVIVTNDKEFDTVKEAVNLGANDYFYKGDFDPEVWDKKLKNLLEGNKAKKEAKQLRKRIKQVEAQHEYVNPPDMPMIGKSPQIERIRRMLKLVADDPDLTVLITGETGVGKGIAARFLHYNSPRANKPYEEIYLTNIPKSLLDSTLFGAKKGSFTDAKTDIKGRLHLADKGIVFLDEIGDLDKEAQTKLLQFLQNKTIRPIGTTADILLDVQIIAATNKNLRQEVQEGNFREDLYQRLKMFPIEIPSLKNRREDIPELTKHFLKLKIGHEIDIDHFLSNTVQDLLFEKYDWIGNVRELENTIKSMLVQQKVRQLKQITVDCLPEEIKNYKKSIFNNLNAGLEINSKSDEGESSGLAHENHSIPNESLTFKQQSAWNTLEAIEKGLKLKNGKKGDVATLMGMKSDDNLRSKIKTLYKNHHRLFEHFPVIWEHYQSTLKKVKPKENGTSEK